MWLTRLDIAIDTDIFFVALIEWNCQCFNFFQIGVRPNHVAVDLQFKLCFDPTSNVNVI